MNMIDVGNVVVPVGGGSPLLVLNTIHVEDEETGSMELVKISVGLGNGKMVRNPVDGSIFFPATDFVKGVVH